MSRRGHSQSREDRKKAKQAERRREHTDKYAGRNLEAKLRQLAEHYSREGDDERH